MMLTKKRSVFLALLTAAAAATSSVFADPSRIVGGKQATPGDYPYFVEMGDCGGALIAPDAVLFAAHCRDWKDRQLSIGAYERSSLSEGAQERFCDVWIPDPKYGTEGSDINYDFALCKLNKPVTFESKVRLELNEIGSVPADGRDLLVMGLGALAEGGWGPDFLHDLTVPTITNNVCNKSQFYNGEITDAMLCAGFAEGKKDSCQGDSGGPIVKRTVGSDGSIVDTHVGVVSWGYGCARENKPGVYARTSVRADWIKDTVCKDFKSVATFCSNTPETPGPCDQELIIRVTTDDYAWQNEWTLKDSNYNDILTRKYLINNYQNEHKLCLKSKESYEWTIYDSYGDGMCDGGCGSYSFTLNGKEIKSGNLNFGSDKTVGFRTGDGDSTPVNAPTAGPVTDSSKPPTNIPTTKPVANPTMPPDNNAGRFQLELKTDAYPDETVLYLYKADENNNVSVDPEDIVYEGYQYKGNLLYILPSENSYFVLEEGCYYFEIYDLFGDGLVGDGQSGEGYYKGFLDDNEIFEGSGDFGEYEDHFFCVGATIFPPTDVPSPSCEDSKDFKWQGKKKKTCKNFLKGSGGKIKKKCKKNWKGTRVFDWCPKTCGKKVGLGECAFLKKLKNRTFLRQKLSN